ncbi:MAG: DUF1592 domain-containing protein [Myxococcota bacterium]
MNPLLAAIALLACRSDGDGKDDPDGPGPTTGVGTTNCGGPCDAVPPTVRFARLTHPQWENSVQDLLQLDAPSGLSGSFIGDTLAEGFENDAENLLVSPELWVDYQRAAESLAAQVIADDLLYARVVPQDPRTGGGGGGGFDEQIEGESGEVTTTTGTNAGSAWNLWSAGELLATFDLPADGQYTLEARVWADQAGPDLARATLGVDGVDALTVDVTAESSGGAEVLSVVVDATAGAHTVHVGFLNDFYDPDAGADRNLYVDWVAVRTGGSGSGTAGPTERDEWISTFGRRAHRRPLDVGEVASYAALFDQGPTLFGTGDDFADGVQLVLTAMLQSPWFIYRVEATPAAGTEPVPLSSYELASKLSYALWNTMPDDALLDLADADGLASEAGLRAEALRLLDDPRARDTIADLHRQALFLDNYDNLFKDPGLYPEFTATTPASMKAEAVAFVDDVVFGDGTVRDLYTRPHTFVNDDLAPIYGLSGNFGDELVPVDLDPNERAGLLTLSGFLSLEADPYISSPIKRGVFVNLHVWCVDLPPPPNNVPPLPASDGQMTTRELVESHTGAGTCGQGCHSTYINPPGYAFENYDALGRYRTEEYGFPIDASGEYPMAAGKVGWDDPLAFSAVVADANETHRCYAQHLLEYVQGRHSTPEDGGRLDRLATASRDDGLAIRELILNLVLDDSFRTRSPEVE